VDFPVLVCHGEGDTTWLPHEQRLLARTIAGATYRIIPDALHSPAQENPEGLLAQLLPFLAAADPPAPDPLPG
jgi:pimeloyl-ACP methyl ester carboxylesterase